MSETLSTPSKESKQSIVFIALLRGIASLLVVWDHMVGAWNDENHQTFRPLTFSRDYFAKPLGIIQDFGYLGVVLFFFVSGFIITHVGRRESQMAFAIKRFLRIYPPLVVSIGVIVLVAIVQSHLTGNGYLFPDYHTGDYLRSLTLWNYFCIPQNPVNGVAWTLVIEVVFYIFCLFTLPLLKSLPLAGSALMTAFCSVVLLRSHDLGDRFFLFADVCGHLPLLLIGQATYLLWAKLVRPWQYFLLLGANYLAFVYALQQVHTDFYPVTNSYGVSTLYAYLLFIIAMLLGPGLRLPRVIQFYSKISYSLYLFHGAIGLTLLDILFPHVGFVWSLLIALIAVTLWSYLSWLIIEEPSQRLARVLVKKKAAESLSPSFWHPNLAWPLAMMMVTIWLLIPLASKPDSVAAISSVESLSQPATAPTSQPADASTPSIEGSLDSVDAKLITGWSFDAAKPSAQLQVDIYIDGKLAGSAAARDFREDLKSAGKGDGLHGFQFPSPAELSDGKPHIISAKEAGTQIELHLSPKSFSK